MNASAHNNVKHTSYYYLAENADTVLVAEIKSISNNTVIGVVRDEEYSTLQLDGEIIDSIGIDKLEREYNLRIPNIGSPIQLGSVGKRIYFIKGNGTSRNPIMPNGIVKIRSDGIVTTPKGHIIRGIDESGKPIFSRGFNECTISEAPELSGAEYTSDGILIREYSRQELLDNLNSFECPNGSQWWRGNDKPRGYKDPPGMTEQQFSQAIRDHMRSKRKRADRQSLTYEIENNPIEYINKIQELDEPDKVIINLINQVDGFVDTIPSEVLEDIYKREKERGRESKFPHEAYMKIEDQVREKEGVK